MIKEWDLLRTIACLSIVTLHATTWMIAYNAFYATNEALQLLRILLCFATPTFILLSVLILSYSYPTQLPSYFWPKRWRFLVLPYVAWAVIYAVIAETVYQKGLLGRTIIENLFRGEFVGWFVLVILQLYMLYALLKKFKITDVVFLPFALVISLLHHAIVQLPYPFFETHQSQLRLLFTGWLSYFAIAYITGKHYKKIAATLLHYRYYTLLLAIASAIFVYINTKLGQLDIHSRRLDLIPFVCSMSAVILAWGQKLPYFKIVRLLSRYAFMIYLIHWQLLWLSSGYIMSIGFSFKVSLVLLVSFTVTGCIAIAWLIGKLPFGAYIVGAVHKEKTH